MKIEGSKITLSFEYFSTIENLDAYLTVDISKTKYPRNNPLLKFKMGGNNKPLIFSSYNQAYKNMSLGTTIFGVIFLVLLFIGLLTPKFIGLEAVITLQLIFYSQLLISDVKKRPVGFVMFECFKFVNGYNDFFSLTNYGLKSDIGVKFQQIQIKKTLI